MDADFRFRSIKAVLVIIGPSLAALGVGIYLISRTDKPAIAQGNAKAQADPFPGVPDDNAPKVGIAAIKSAGPFANRKQEYRSELNLEFGGTKDTAKGVNAALYWLAKHQMKDGNWSLQKYTLMCKDKSCTGAASIESLSAATAFGLLPFLAAGQTQSVNGPFQRSTASGIHWLLSHQKADGDLSADAASHMYSHGLATIALCEDYGMTHDASVGRAAQRAVDFIEAAQNTKTGGWRYRPGEDGDTSVLGWQLTALKTAKMAGLSVKQTTFDGAKKWLHSVSAGGGNNGKFSYEPDGAPTPTMSAVGILGMQYLHADRNDPVNSGGVEHLMANLPDVANRNIYYWYYATQVVHNMADKDWDTWNQKMRQILVDSQVHEGCATGSWDPDKPNRDAWGPYGGRVMVTSLSCLTLEVYHRSLPVYEK